MAAASVSHCHPRLGLVTSRWPPVGARTLGQASPTGRLTSLRPLYGVFGLRHRLADQVVSPFLVLASPRAFFPRLLVHSVPGFSI